MILITQRIITLLAILVTLSCKRNAKAEKFLIPNGRVGSIVIFHDQANGQQKLSDGHRLVYLIPPSGSLSTKSTTNDGWLDQEYYYIDERGNERRILIDSSQLYFNEPAKAKRFKAQHSKDTLIMQWGISGVNGEKRYQEFVIGSYQSPNSIDTSFFDN